MRPLAILSITILAIAPGAAAGQAVALDPGLMTGYAGGAAVHYDNQRRARGYTRADAVPTMSVREARARRNCSRKGVTRMQLGDGDPRVAELYRLCAQLGY